MKRIITLAVAAAMFAAVFALPAKAQPPYPVGSCTVTDVVVVRFVERARIAIVFVYVQAPGSQRDRTACRVSADGQSRTITLPGGMRPVPVPFVLRNVNRGDPVFGCSANCDVTTVQSVGAARRAAGASSRTRSTSPRPLRRF